MTYGKFWHLESELTAVDGKMKQLLLDHYCYQGMLSEICPWEWAGGENILVNNWGICSNRSEEQQHILGFGYYDTLQCSFRKNVHFSHITKTWCRERRLWHVVSGISL